MQKQKIDSISITSRFAKTEVSVVLHYIVVQYDDVSPEYLKSHILAVLNPTSPAWVLG